MIRTFVFCLTIFIILLSGCKKTTRSFPDDFGEKVYRHIVHLSAQIGERESGSDSEALAANYVRGQLIDIGIDTELEKFSFETFRLDSAILKIGDSKYEVKQIYFNPYDSIYSFQGNFITIDSIGRPDGQSITDRIVITHLENQYFFFAKENARLVLIVDPFNYKEIKRLENALCDVGIFGKMANYQSQNVAGHLIASVKTKKFIIIGAHHDTYPTSPGADDNASGVGALIELARYFKSMEDRLNTNIRFISFGSEEKGILGSRIYLNQHGPELEDCILMYNMDNIGGPSLMIEAKKGVNRNFHVIGGNEFPAITRNRPWEAIGSSWRILEPEIFEVFAITNKPEWIINVIDEVLQELEIEVRKTGNLGADQQTFTQAGIVATSIGTSGNVFHTPDDTHLQINKTSLQQVGQISTEIILKTMDQMKDRKMILQ